MGFPWESAKANTDEVKSQQDLELGEFREKLKAVDEVKTTVSELKESLSSISEFVAEQRRMQEDSRRREAEAKKPKPTQVTEDDWLLDPRKAFLTEIQPVVHDTINTRSMFLRKEILADKEYYEGDFRKKVDNYIDSLPPNQKTEPASIENCYNLVLGQHMQEIKENKLKSRFSAVSSASSGEESKSVDSSQNRELTEQEKKVARVFGITPEDFIKTRREMSYIS